MWLINTTTLKLEHIIDPEENDTKYAILSHTWDEEEVSFQQFSNLDAARKLRGFAKIEKTCQLARQEGLDYAWVDTCCIDKISSSELSEAINSMFNWYRVSSVCFTYLSDLRDSARLDNLDPKCSPSLALSKCRWFTRGWTLQELIAPSNVEFYNFDWQIVGHKTMMSPQLAMITGIDAGVLLGHVELDSVPVCKRMSWAANRNTARVEDVAYSLLGIFGINLPLIYGEGPKAFQRLQEEILRTTDDMSILAWSPKLTVDRKLLPPLFKRTNTRPRFRGPFAWAPSEFSSTFSSSRGKGSLLASAMKMDLAHGCVVITSGGGIYVNCDIDTGDTWLVIPGSAEPGRRIEMTPGGYAFVNDPEVKQPKNLRSVEMGNLRLISHKDAMAFGANPVHVHCRVRTRLDEEYNLPPPTTWRWPTIGHSPIGCALVYSESDILVQNSRLRSSDLALKKTHLHLLGVVARQVALTVPTGQYGQTVRRLTLLFCFGVILTEPEMDSDADKTKPQPAPQAQYFGVTFCKESNDPTSARVCQAMDNKKSTMYVHSIRNTVESILRRMLQRSPSPAAVAVFKEWALVIEIPCGPSINSHVRISTVHFTDEKPGTMDSIQRFELKFERGVAGQWIEMKHGQILRRENFFTPKEMCLRGPAGNARGGMEQQRLDDEAFDPVVANFGARLSINGNENQGPVGSRGSQIGQPSGWRGENTTPYPAAMPPGSEIGQSNGWSGGGTEPYP